ncbi:flavin reductase family protein [uncultured Alsobacter sp.]|uniref:flavin reductase family protein n=1 Tax=uncultured Alsobacter sp. TaxID=1748258 RepID=UPI0025FF2458|nr:flavin reductase family protein [uncultured Alsobacter sp.]
MFYDTVTYGHGLPHDPLKAIVAPRPIGWISSLNKAGELNLAPYSFFNAFSSRPPIVGFSSEGRKDSVTFVEETGEFVCNLATWDLRDAMNATSAPLARGKSEFEHARLEQEPSRLVKPPRVKGVAAALECKLVQVVQLSTHQGEPMDTHLVLGQVVGVFIDDAYITPEGRFDMLKARPIARCGYADYAVVDSAFALERPTRA